MRLSDADKKQIRHELVERLKAEPEIRKLVIFGSFSTSPEPNDLDLAIFQDSAETYLPLAMKYRKLLRSISDRIPLDVIPVRPAGAHGPLLDEINRGEVIYES
jgi:predicted nucleotidyltransferase